MKILFASREADGIWHGEILRRAGHDVDFILKEQKYDQTLRGIVPPFLTSPPEVDTYDLVVFDSCDSGKMADEMREYTPVIGSSAFAQNLEEDRLAGIQFMEQSGIKVPEYEVFDDISPAVAWLKKLDKPAVFKPFGNELDKATTYVGSSVDDLIDYLEKLFSKVKVKEFLLQEKVEGTEVSTEGWFNGEHFYAVNHTLEEKKFMSGGIGPNTGCAGNVLWMPEDATVVFREGLAKAAEGLKKANFVGPIDLNTIATKEELYGLEWTPRFGYEGTCNLIWLLPMEFGQFMYEIARGGTPMLTQTKAAFAATIRCSVPPYPNPSKPEKYEGVPVKGIDIDNLEAFYLSDVRLVEGSENELETIGVDGWIGSPIATGPTIKDAFDKCEEMISDLQIPDLQYRSDVGKCCEKRYNQLEKNGWLDVEKAAKA
jgi:phosphoribosylamine-glycine ligase